MLMRTTVAGTVVASLSPLREPFVRSLSQPVSQSFASSGPIGSNRAVPNRWPLLCYPLSYRPLDTPNFSRCDGRRVFPTNVLPVVVGTRIATSQRPFPFNGASRIASKPSTQS